MEKHYIHPLPVRIWHWVNALGFLTMIATGVQIRYLDLVQLFPFKTAVMVHNWVGLLLIANYFLWLGFYMFSDKITVYLPETNPAKFFQEFWKQLKYYGHGIFLGEVEPHVATAHHKFNPMQLMTYQIIMLLVVPVLFFSGLLLWDVTQFASIVAMFGGIRMVDTVHVLMFIVCTGFLIMHLYLITLGHTLLAHIKPMLTGYETVNKRRYR